MKHIFYFAENSTLGNLSSYDCDKYRDWAKQSLERRFPFHTIEVHNEPSVRGYETNDINNEAEIRNFCSRLCDNYPT